MFLSAVVVSGADGRAADAPPVNAQKLAEVDAIIADAIARHELPGAVLYVGRGGEAVYRKAYGNRAVEPTPAEMTVDTIFDLASLSKPVGCATSIMILADRGKLALTDKAAKHLPAFAAAGKENVTIEQLLLHRGGLVPDNALADYDAGPEAAMRNVFALKPQWEPGTHFAYSDVGYIVLGEVVRAVDGRPLDRFAREEIFHPLGMGETAYNPPPQWKPRCAPTQQRDGHWMVGEVHDPRAFALGGVAGHAGLFGTADDLAGWCRMILGRGAHGGKRILSPGAVAAMTEPHPVTDGAGVRSYGFDVDTPYSSPRGERFGRGTTFGHTGFTGTSLWIDPPHDCFVILLSNSVHPDGKGKVVALRRRVSTVVAEAMLGPAEPGGTTRPATQRATATAAAMATTTGPAAPAPVLCGIDVLERDHFAALKGRSVAVVTNQTGRTIDGRRTADVLAGAAGVKVVCLLSPEHGLYGTLDEKVGHTTDPKTGLKVYSLYGQTRRPTDDMLAGVDTLVFDVQDVGTRFYTYVSTMGLCMEAAARRKLRMVVLDRPDPITGVKVDGPLADEAHLGFTAYAPIPLVHGMTLGELARLFNEERGIHCDLAVVPVQGWRRSMGWDETGLAWVNPSPNMRNLTQAELYPCVGLLEASNVSVGRGTDQPFEYFGAPWVEGRHLAAALNASGLPGLRFVPVEFTPASSRFAGQPCGGVYVMVTDRGALQPARAGLTIAWQLRALFGTKYDLAAVERMLQNSAAGAALRDAKDLSEVSRLPETWREPLERFKTLREKYLLYP